MGLVTWDLLCNLVPFGYFRLGFVGLDARNTSKPPDLITLCEGSRGLAPAKDILVQPESNRLYSYQAFWEQFFDELT